ncbi:MAG TPA: hypothetical protein VMA75_01990 [Candidatus Paceibacterota bacterium]|nr:hypothetical protein [Candidatus Paceibacterota bacterium]
MRTLIALFFAATLAVSGIALWNSVQANKKATEALRLGLVQHAITVANTRAMSNVAEFHRDFDARATIKITFRTTPDGGACLNWLVVSGAYQGDAIDYDIYPDGTLVRHKNFGSPHEQEAWQILPAAQ